MRRGRCATCHAGFVGVAARWCGSCGAALTGEGPEPSRLRRDIPSTLRTGLVVVILLGGLGGVLGVMLTGAADEFGSWTAGRSSAADDAIDLPDRLQDGVRADGRSGSPDDGVSDGRASLGGQLHCLSVDCIAWSVDVQPSSPGTLAVQHDLVVVGERASIVAIDARSGEVRWRVALDLDVPAFRPASIVVVDDQVVASIGDGHRLQAVGLSEGELRWERTIDEAATVTQARLVGDDLTVVMSSSPERSGCCERVMALDPTTGGTRWTSRLAQHATLTASGPVVLHTDRMLRGHDPRDGSERWAQPTEAALPPVLSTFGEHIVLSDEPGVTVLDAADGTFVASFATTDGFPPIESADALLVLDREVVGYLDVEGRTWTSQVVRCCLGASVDDDRITVLLDDGTLQTFDREDGRPLERRSRVWDTGTDERPLGLSGRFLFTGDPASDRFVATVRDAETGLPIARLDGAFPAGSTADGALLLVSNGRLTALLPTPSSTSSRMPSGG